MSNVEHISIALPKGRLAEDTLELFSKAGICSKDIVDFNSRKLIFTDEKSKLTCMIVRNTDIPAYLENGAADIGVVGHDVLLESGLSLYEFLDLKFGYCRLCSAAIKADNYSYVQNMKVATKYPNITRKFFASKGIMVDIVKLYGSIEIAPIVKISDIIVDLVSSGETLRKNGLAEVETIMESTARLVGNKSLAKVKHRRLKEIISLLSKELGK